MLYTNQNKILKGIMLKTIIITYVIIMLNVILYNIQYNMYIIIAIKILKEVLHTNVQVQTNEQKSHEYAGIYSPINMVFKQQMRYFSLKISNQPLHTNK